VSTVAQAVRQVGYSGCVSNAVVTAIKHRCDMGMQRAFESPPTQLIVNQAAGVAVNAAAAAAVQPAKASHAR
jgi:hypothetical protein